MAEFNHSCLACGGRMYIVNDEVSCTCPACVFNTTPVPVKLWHLMRTIAKDRYRSGYNHAVVETEKALAKLSLGEVPD